MSVSFLLNDVINKLQGIYIKGLMRSKTASGYFSFYVDNISLKTYSTWNFSKIPLNPIK